MEPTTSTATAAVSVGLAGLLTAAFGGVAADVMMVVLASVAGTFIGLSGSRTHSSAAAAKFLIGALLVSLTLAWALASVVSSLHPALASPYTPTIVAFLIGANAARLKKYADRISTRIDDKLGVSE